MKLIGYLASPTRRLVTMPAVPAFSILMLTAGSTSSTAAISTKFAHPHPAMLAPTNGVSVCIVDDSNGNQLQFDKNTGAYTFTNCSSFTLRGTGQVTIKGSLITLTHVSDGSATQCAGGRCNKKGQSQPPGAWQRGRTIMDRNTANDVCGCDAMTE